MSLPPRTGIARTRPGPRRALAGLACLSALICSLPLAAGQPSPTTAPASPPASTGLAPNGRSARDQFRSEVDSLLRSAVVRPYGSAYSAEPDPGARGPIASFEPGHTPAAGLIFLLAADTLGNPAYRDTALQIARATAFAMESTGRVPGTVQLLPGQVAQREPHGQTPRRPPTTASLGFLLYLDLTQPAPPSDAPPTDTSAASADSRAASAATRAASFLIKQQLRTGAFPSSLEVPGEKYPKRILRLDQPDARDTALALLLIQRAAQAPSPGRETALPAPLAKIGAQRALDLLLKQRFSELGRPSRHLWPAATDLDASPLTGVPSLPPAGNLLATRYAMQTLLAFHLDTGSADAFEVLRLAGETVTRLRATDGLWTLIDDPANRFPPPPPTPSAVAPPPSEPAPGTFTPQAQRPALSDLDAPTWPRDDFGLPGALRTLADLRLLQRDPFLKLTGRSLPPDLLYAALLTGLTDQFPTADLPLSRGQVAPFVAAHPALFAGLEGPEPVELSDRTRRLFALYLLARWETDFSPPVPR